MLRPVKLKAEVGCQSAYAKNGTVGEKTRDIDCNLQISWHDHVSFRGSTSLHILCSDVLTTEHVHL